MTWIDATLRETGQITTSQYSDLTLPVIPRGLPQALYGVCN